jgi:putative FmdB family regulatory protein
MPLYHYKCQNCKTGYDQFLKLADYKTPVPCPRCGRIGEKVITAQIQRDEPTWLNDEVRGCLQDTESEAPIETRTEYKRYLKDNGIIERS